MVVASGVDFSEVWRPEKNFALAGKVTPQFACDRRAQSQVALKLLPTFA